MFSVRHAQKEDFKGIFELYKKVAAHIQGIARVESEITEKYISHFMESALANGVELVVTNDQHENKIIAEVHCYKLFPQVFNHVLSELTIVVDPDFHGLGIGKKIFTHLLEFIKKNRKDILRLELIARESNKTAISFYQKIGFVIEGRFENRIKSDKGLEADIPMAWFNPYYS